MVKFNSISFITLIFLVFSFFNKLSHCGVPIPGLQSGPTPFQSIFATGFGGSYNTFGTGTTAGAIGAYGRFVTGGANTDTHGSAGYGHGRK